MAANLLNPVISSFHVLYESTPHDQCPELYSRMSALIIRNWYITLHDLEVLKSKFGCTEILEKRATLQEILILYPQKLFNTFSSSNKDTEKNIAVIINADIVLDSSLARLSSLESGFVAVLSVNTGPDMTNCCFDQFQRIISSENSNLASQSRARHNKEDEIPEDLLLSCNGLRIENDNELKIKYYNETIHTTNNQSQLINQNNYKEKKHQNINCPLTLPGSDSEEHVVRLRQFYRSSRRDQLREKDERLTCSNSHWSTGGFQFCGSPKTNQNIAVSWDGYAYVLPLPSQLFIEDHPWFNGVNFQLDDDDDDKEEDRQNNVEKIDHIDSKTVFMNDPNLKNGIFPSGLMHMNQNGVEARASCALKSAGLNLINPCRYIRIAHWHCDAKTHHGKNRYDKGLVMEFINNYVASHPKYGNKLSEFESCSSFDVTNYCGDIGADSVKKNTVCGGIDIS